jgi:hypothetical protein
MIATLAIPVLVLLMVALVWMIVFGVRRWGELGGKIIVIGASLLLTALLLFVSFVALNVAGVQNNAPL